MIRLEVDEKISELAPGFEQPRARRRRSGPRRRSSSRKDQQTILIGGLMSDKAIDTVTKVPLLGDIPILGFFFRSRRRRCVKTNLIIALTPYVISDMSDLRRVLEKKMRERREFIERLRRRRSGRASTPTIDYRRKAACSRRSTASRVRSQSEAQELQQPARAGAAGRVGARRAARRTRGGRRRPPRPAPAARRPCRHPEELAVAKKRLGDLLLELKAKTPGAMPTLGPEAIEQALATQQLEGGRLGEILLKMRVITEEDLLQALGQQLGIPYSPDLKTDDVDIDLATSIPIGFAKQHRLLVVKREGDSAMVATGDPLEVGALDDLRMQLALDVQPFLVPSQRDPRGHQRRLRAQGTTRAASSATRTTRTTRGAARSWSTSSTSPTRRRSSAGSTRCCSTRSRSGPATSTSSRARRRSWSATASTACCTRRAAPPASSCRRSSRA